MLRLRVLTALALLAVVLLAIFALSPLLFSLFLAAVVLVGAWEWSRLAGYEVTWQRVIFVLVYGGLLYLSGRYLDSMLLPMLLISLLWWLAAWAMVARYPRHTSLWGSRPALSLLGMLVLVPGWMALLYLRRQADFAILIILLLALVASADIGAYFTGRAWGRRKLAPAVSPNKTWEGFWGGVFSCCLLIVIAALVYTSSGANLSPAWWAQLVLFAVALAALSTVGDLLESMIKRFRDVKDSGNILPGHGGILDRIDGITAAAPVYALLVMNLGGMQ